VRTARDKTHGRIMADTSGEGCDGTVLSGSDKPEGIPVCRYGARLRATMESGRVSLARRFPVK